MVTYADRPWLKSYDSHVPANLEYPEGKVIHDYLQETAAQRPDQPVLITTAKLPLLGRLDAHITFRELDQASDALAAALVDMGLKKGDRVAIVLPNCTAFGIAFFGILKAGGAVAATNPTYPKTRMQHQIDDCGAEIVICLSYFYKMIKEIQPETRVKTVIAVNIKDYMPGIAKLLFTLTREKKGGHRIEQLHSGDHMFMDVVARYAGRKVNVDVQPDDTAVLQYTGGTTGVSKGAIGTHHALITNLVAMQTWLGLFSDDLTYPDPLIYLGAIPMFHVYGLLVLLTQGVAGGGQIILVPNPRDMDEVVSVIDHYKPNVFLGVPALYNSLNNHPRIQSGEISLKNFIISTSGSAPLPTTTQEEYDKRAGRSISEGYGMSETFVIVSGNPVAGEKRLRSVGLPYPDMDIKIVQTDDPDVEVPVGEVGELVVTGPNLMKGYHGMPTETANMLRNNEEDGKTWLYTGDMARMDEDGYLYIVDRKKDMALIGGFNVYPASVEDALKKHPAVFEVGVAAIPHPEREGQEALKAWIVTHPGKSVKADELIKHCEQYLAQYEIPRRYAFIDELPKTAVGKTLRRQLIQMELEELQTK